MQKIGYSLVKLLDGEEVATAEWLPARLSFGGNSSADFDQPGQVVPDSEAPTHKLVERWGDAAPGPQHTLTSETKSFDGTKVTLSRTWTAPPAPPVTPSDIQLERARRLGLGFDYDFGDARGVHHIGTNEEDMKGWDEVAKASGAFIALGQSGAEFTIVTNTGPATVTALEFQGILAAAAQARQPIWAASFVLQQMNPLPADYTDDSYWEPA